MRYVLIKGINMPKCCDSCNFRSVSIMGGVYCDISCKDLTPYDLSKSRHESCPIVEITDYPKNLISIRDIIEYGRSKGYEMVTLDLLEQVDDFNKSNKTEV